MKVYDYDTRFTFGKHRGKKLIDHRKAILEKIKKYESENHVKLNWILYGN